MESTNLREPVTIITCSTTAAAAEEDLEKASSKKQQQQQQLPNKLKLIPVIFFIYFEVAGGPYGLEPVVKANGPLLAILGFIVFPFIWSIPEALITAELCTALPSNGGFILWGEKAFGPLGGSLLASWKFFSEVMDISAYPVLCVNYLQRIFPAVGSGTPRNLFVSVFVLSLSILNYTGMGVVGYASVALGVLSVIPFLVMFFFSIPLIKPRMWMSLGEKGVERDWNLYFNILFWNLNAWDHVSTVAGEVDNPRKTFPRALLSAVVLTCSLFLGVLLSVSGAVSVHQREWGSGFFADAAEIIAGKWLMIWVEIGAVLCTIGSFEAQLTSSLYQLVGMAEMGLLPAILGRRSRRFGTPWVAILVSTAITLGASYMDFPNIISSSNCLYSLGMLLEFASFLQLRWVLPELMRPYRVPVGMPLLIVMSSISCGFFVLMLAIATKLELMVCGGLTLFGIGCYFLTKFFKKRKWLKFNGVDDEEESTDDESVVHESNLGVVFL